MPVMAVKQLLSSSESKQPVDANLPRILLPADNKHISSVQSDPVSRKRSHMASEQKRRQQINEGFEALRRLVPSCQRSPGPDSKATILQKTVNYIEQLHRELGRGEDVARKQIRLSHDEPHGKVKIKPKPSSPTDDDAVTLNMLANCAVESSPSM